MDALKNFDYKDFFVAIRDIIEKFYNLLSGFITKVQDPDVK